MLADLRSERLNVVRRLGKPDTSYRKLTFYKAHLEQDRHVDAVLLGPGHPVYGAVDERLQELLGDVAGQTAVYVDPLTEAPYRPHFYEISVRGQTTRGAATTLHAELVGVREEIGEGVLDADRYRIVPADALIDLSAHPAPPETLPAIDPGSIGDYVKATVQMDRRQAAQAERRHYADVARDYLKRSFDARVRARRTLPISNARKGNASPASNGCASRVTWPAAWVLPPEAPNDHSLAAADEADAALKRQIELAAEEVVVAYEESQERECERVGHQKIGFDIRSLSPPDPQTGYRDPVTGVRRIEVKGRKRGQPVRLTTNE